MESDNKFVNPVYPQPLRKPYNPPRLIQWGTIAEMTGGLQGGGQDWDGSQSAYPQAPGRPKSLPLT